MPPETAHVEKSEEVATWTLLPGLPLEGFLFGPENAYQVSSTWSTEGSWKLALMTGPEVSCRLSIVKGWAEVSEARQDSSRRATGCMLEDIEDRHWR